MVMRAVGAFLGRVVTVVGASRSGLAAARLLLQQGAHVSITDASHAPQARATIAQLQRLDTRGALRVELGKHTPRCLTDSSLVVTSPGVRADAPPLHWARRDGIAIISEIELASWFCPAPIIAVTGTNGKSTVTTMMTALLTAAGLPAIACGNIGYPFADAVEQLTPAHYAVVEVSSFQLEHCKTFRPHIAVLLNIAPNHLDHHASMEDYVETKYRLCAQQRSTDWTVLNTRDPLVAHAAERTGAQAVWFDTQAGHPLWQAAFRVGDIMQIPAATMRAVAASFRGLAHRQEHVHTTDDGVRYINDSKSTTPASLQWALETLDGPLIVIAGGKNKGLDFRPVVSTIARLNHQRPHARPQIRSAILIGDTRTYLRDLFNPLVQSFEAESLNDAVAMASRQAHEGDTVVLSPGCASFDMFQNFEDRGTQFTRLVRAHEQEHICVNDYAST